MIRVFITGLCGFVGSSLALALIEQNTTISVTGVDNFIRPGSEANRLRLKHRGVQVIHGDVRLPSDFESLPAADWVVDAAANPSVLAGVDGRSTSRQVVEHNLMGTVNVLEYCKAAKAGLILLSTSRVYSAAALSTLPLAVRGQRFVLDEMLPLPPGISTAGIREDFSTCTPISFYGSTKLASEVLASEYGATFGFPVWINRCGVVAGAGQMGTAEQGIFSYWLHAYAQRRPLTYIGFDGTGRQVRDAFHPSDLAQLVLRQMAAHRTAPRLLNVGGGADNAMSLAELSDWCRDRFGGHPIGYDPRPRRFDVPWVVMDSARAANCYAWRPHRTLPDILGEIAAHLEENPDWLDRTAI